MIIVNVIRFISDQFQKCEKTASTLLRNILHGNGN